MYYRISGAPFTIKNAEEKKEFIDVINSDEIFSKHLVCRGVTAEQFTGKITGITVCEKENPNKVYIFICEGNFPTLKLYQRTSPVVYPIEFPVSEKKEIFNPIIIEDPKPAAGKKVEEVIQKIEEAISQPEVQTAELKVTEDKPQPECEIQTADLKAPEVEVEISQNDVFSTDPFEREQPVLIEPAVVTNPDQPKKRGRKKKNH